MRNDNSNPKPDGPGNASGPPVEGTARARVLGERVRVRLLIAFPLLIALLLSIVGGVFFQMVEAEFRTPVGPSPENPARRLAGFAQDWLVAMIVVDIVGAAVGFLIAFSITSPIRKIISISERIAEGDFSEKAAINRSDEMGMLGHTFNYMIDSLNQFILSRNRFILESFTGGLITTDTNGTVTAVNTAAEQILGVEAGDATGKSIQTVFRAPGVAALRATIEEALWKRENIVSRKLSVAHGSREFPVCVNTSLMYDRKGNAFGLIVNFRDLDEWERFHKQMARTDQLATLGTFAAGLAHEIRNPLGAIKGMAQLLAEAPTSNPKSLEYAQIIVKETNRLDAIVREVQEFSQPSTAPAEWTNLNEIARKSLLLAQNNPKAPPAAGITIVEDYADLPATHVAGDKITQALLNIITNAIQATPEGGTMTVRTRHLPDNDLPVRIEIANSGSTIPADCMSRVFEPFFTTKEGGSGLGLSIALQIVRHHGGEITLNSPGNTVEFAVRLPLNRPDEAVTL
jgi:PAS domain S-box-containing protein